jgi:hypothetical protein
VWTAKLGEYPHAQLNPEMRPVKKQTTRMIKMECKVATCGYVCRSARKWITSYGAVVCPKHGKPMSYDPSDLADEGDEEEGDE